MPLRVSKGRMRFVPVPGLCDRLGVALKRGVDDRSQEGSMSEGLGEMSGRLGVRSSCSEARFSVEPACVSHHYDAGSSRRKEVMSGDYCENEEGKGPRMGRPVADDICLRLPDR